MTYNYGNNGKGGYSSNGQTNSPYAQDAAFQAMITERNKTLRSIGFAKLRMNVYKGVFIAGFFVLLWNASFTYTSLVNFLNNVDQALGITVLITAVQIIVNASFFSGSLRSFQLFDLNGDGKITPLEMLISAIFLIGIGGSYLLDIGTNLLGVDVIGAQELGLGIGGAFLTMFQGMGLPNIVIRIVNAFFMVLASLVPLFCAFLLCIGDELCTILAEREISRIQATLPDLKRAKAILDKRIRDADAFSQGVGSQSSDGAWKQGVNFRI